MESNYPEYLMGQKQKSKCQELTNTSLSFFLIFFIPAYLFQYLYLIFVNISLRCLKCLLSKDSRSVPRKSWVPTTLFQLILSLGLRMFAGFLITLQTLDFKQFSILAVFSQIYLCLCCFDVDNYFLNFMFPSINSLKIDFARGKSAACIKFDSLQAPQTVACYICILSICVVPGSQKGLKKNIAH